ncbi:hypothetical protein [Bifidobacterium stellenboschense]|uniref:Uncharacterized protein n=1 Tax=Bifidobacterium stellenboschense TaxID=762211 RepID=A0A087DN65_9BIFI|nr:hypothetical protein [Bifidobacterium stellenboschense]KFI96965.1 hypothetical protein BSTEL_1874 [Bifidobacterium stellenboschense]
MNGETVSQWNAKRGAMLGVQVFAYALLIVIGAVWALADTGAGIIAMMIATVLLAVVLVLFHVYWPFRATIIDRVIGLVAGALSLVFVTFPAAGKLFMVNDDSRAVLFDANSAEIRWAAAVAGLLVVLTIVSFGRQMLREERSHLIRALSHCVTGGAAAISLAGWLFFPYVVAGAITAPTILFAGVVAVMVLFALVLAYASVWWLRELDADPAQRAPWIGVALLPVMFFGLVSFAAALFLQIVG